MCYTFGGAGKFCLAHGLRRLTRDVTSELYISEVTSRIRHHDKHRMLFGKGPFAMENIKSERNDER